MTPEGRKIWNSKAGVSLLDKMLTGKKPSPQDRETIRRLKESGPPKKK